MAWRQQKTWQDQPRKNKPNKGHKPWEEERRPPKGQPKDAENYMVGYDGKKVPIPMEAGSTSSSSSSTSDSLVDELKGMIRQLAQGVPLTPDQVGALEEDPRVALAKQQKQLNQQRKTMNKERGLESRLKANEEKYVNWATAQKALLRSEKDRFESEQQKMEKELQMLRNPVVEEEEEMSEDEGPTARPKDAVMEARVLQAEKMAWDAQQAFLAIQSQLQVTMGQISQLTALQSNYAMPPQPNLPAAPPMPAATPPGFPTGTGMAPSPKMNTAPGGSPQMPRTTRVAPQPGTATVAKSHLKASTRQKETHKEGKETKEVKDNKVQDSTAEAVKGQTTEVVDLADDDEPQLL